MNARRVLQFLPVAGLILHLTFLILLNPLAELIEDRVWKQIDPDPDFVWNGGAAFWDPGYDSGAVVACFPVCIYLPTGVLALAIYVSFRHRRPKPWAVLLSALGAFTIVYALFWLVSSA